MKEISVMLGGEFPKEIDPSSYWCGVDKGALYLIKQGIRPILSCGDFDSISNKEKQEVREKSNKFFIKESQYITDADFALGELMKIYPEVEIIKIYGATGKRLDHFFGNILLLNNTKYKDIKVSIIDNNNIITLAQSGKTNFSKIEDYKYFSVVPIYPQTTMTIKNSKYEAEKLILSQDRPNATSNEFFEDKEIQLDVNKNVLVIYSKD